MRKAEIPGYKLKYLYERGGRYVYRRAIPPELRPLASGRTEFKESLRTSEAQTAIVRYAETHSQVEAMLDQLRQGKPLSQRPTPPVAELRDIAQSRHGLLYQDADQLIRRADIGHIMERFAIWGKAGKPIGTDLHAIFGTATNAVTLNDCLSYYEHHTRDRLIGLNDRESAKKRNPVRLAVRRFNEFAGPDLDITAIGRDLARAYRSHLTGQIELGSIVANTADKQLTQLRKVLTFYIEEHGLEIANPFAKVSFKSEPRSRPTFALGFIRRNWLEKQDAFSGLNGEAKGILFAMIDTGCGGGEICGLAPEDIKIDATIPHIIVRPNEFRRLKTGHRGRTIALVGNSLAAFREHPSGFPRYRKPNGGENVSAVLMKFLRENDLFETPTHKVYSIRHMFKDRMRHHGFPDELHKYLMGHSDDSMGARYGSGYRLEDQHAYMKRLEADWV